MFFWGRLLVFLKPESSVLPLLVSTPSPGAWPTGPGTASSVPGKITMPVWAALGLFIIKEAWTLVCWHPLVLISEQTPKRSLDTFQHSMCYLVSDGFLKF